jgi:acetyl-CoA acetyltransferase
VPRLTPKGRQPAIVGIHALPYSRDIGMTERRSGALAILGALAEAGLGVRDVDGICRYVWQPTTEMEMARILGVPNLRWFGAQDYGGGAGPPTVALACAAIELGLADCVVVWRSRNRSSGGRPWAGQMLAEGQDQFERPMGVVRPVDGFALLARVWMRTWGWTREDLGRVAITVRGHANRNPAAMMHARRLTMEEYLSARMIAEPLCLYDNCLETDGALACVLVPAERARDLDLAHPPAYVTGYALGSGPDRYAMTNYYGEDLLRSPNAAIAPELWRRTGLGPADIDVCQIYDAFTPQIPLAFQEFGFCGEGEGAAFCASEACPPYNTSGGGLSEAYVHGFNLIVEGVRQVRGTSTSQVPDARHCLVTGGNVVPTGALVLSREPW